MQHNQSDTLWDCLEACRIWWGVGHLLQLCRCKAQSSGEMIMRFLCNSMELADQFPLRYLAKVRGIEYECPETSQIPSDRDGNTTGPRIHRGTEWTPRFWMPQPQQWWDAALSWKFRAISGNVDKRIGTPTCASARHEGSMWKDHQVVRELKAPHE